MYVALQRAHKPSTDDLRNKVHLQQAYIALEPSRANFLNLWSKA